jgi:hypothetical protein
MTVEIAQSELSRRGNREKGIELSRTVSGVHATGDADPTAFGAFRQAGIDGHLEVGKRGAGGHRPNGLGGGR